MHRALTALGTRVLSGLLGAVALTGLVVFLANPTGQAVPPAPKAKPVPVVTVRQQAQHASRAREAAQAEAARMSMRVMSPMPKWKITATFGESNGRWWNKHTGLDLQAKYGSRVKAVAAGVVIKTTYDRYYGRIVVVRGNGYDVWYGHLAKIGVRLGDLLHAGSAIGKLGASGHVTGPHLHIEVRVHDLPTNPRHFLWGPTMGHPDPSPLWAHSRITRLSDL